MTVKSTKLAVGESSCWIWTVSVICIYSVALLQGWNHRLLEIRENKNSQTEDNHSIISAGPLKSPQCTSEKSPVLSFVSPTGELFQTFAMLTESQREYFSSLTSLFSGPESKATVSDSFRRTEHISISMYGCVCQYICAYVHIYAA